MNDKQKTIIFSVFSMLIVIAFLFYFLREINLCNQKNGMYLRDLFSGFHCYKVEKI